jgi:hypothetical protein
MVGGGANAPMTESASSRVANGDGFACPTAP